MLKLLLNALYLAYAQLTYRKVQILSRIERLKTILASKIAIFSLKGESLIVFMERTHPGLHEQREKLLGNMRLDETKNIVFTFRTLHFIDWFAPIHLALERLYPGHYHILYIDYATTLHRIGSGLEYFTYRGQVQSRMLRLGINPLLHFSHEEMAAFNPFPKFSAGVTCEAIRQEELNLSERIYLPHYILPKAIDRVLPQNIRFNHALLPSLPPFSYASVNDGAETGKVAQHQTGYPKECITNKQTCIFPESQKPVVIFAPSLEAKLLKRYVKERLVDVLRDNPQWNFVIKFHPSLESRRHYIVSYIKLLLKGFEHVRFDTLSDIHSLSEEASLLITDYGSVGGEFKLLTGKRVIYLEIPSEYEGGADLKFRDHFSDALCSVKNLPQHIEQLLAMEKLSSEELSSMRSSVLSQTEAPDEQAANFIHRLLS